MAIGIEGAQLPPAPILEPVVTQTNVEVEEKDSEDEEEVEAVDGEKKKKKKKKKSKAKKMITSAAAQELQTEPPSIPISTMFRNGTYPIGETFDYLGENAYRTTSEEKRHLERIAMESDPSSSQNYNSIRLAAQVHRQVRSYAQKTIKPGMTMIQIADLIENGTRALVDAQGMERGIGFPTGLSLNHCAAHYTPNAGDTIVLKHEDVMKVDFGVQVNGRIVDSAFTMSWEPTYDNLLLAVKDATNTGIREAGIDVRTADIGAAIQEVMESYEVEIQGKVLPVKSIKNLTGHSINPYVIHGGKSVPIVSGQDPTEKMEEGEYFAIETFGSTGKGFVRNTGECSHYAKNMDTRYKPQRKRTQELMKTIDKEFGSLPFCRRYLDRAGEKGYLMALNDLVQDNLVMDYPPLSDVVGCMTAQYEHTIILRPTCKEVVSRGDDY